MVNERIKRRHRAQPLSCGLNRYLPADPANGGAQKTRALAKKAAALPDPAGVGGARQPRTCGAALPAAPRTGARGATCSAKPTPTAADERRPVIFPILGSTKPQPTPGKTPYTRPGEAVFRAIVKYPGNHSHPLSLCYTAPVRTPRTIPAPVHLAGTQCLPTRAPGRDDRPALNRVHRKIILMHGATVGAAALLAPWKVRSTVWSY